MNYLLICWICNKFCVYSNNSDDSSKIYICPEEHFSCIYSKLYDEEYFIDYELHHNGYYIEFSQNIITQQIYTISAKRNSGVYSDLKLSKLLYKITVDDFSFDMEFLNKLLNKLLNNLDLIESLS